MGIIYCYTNQVNNKKYIGQTINPEQRYVQHKSSAFNEKSGDYNSPLHIAFRKYGYEKFHYEILAKDIDEIEILNSLEVYYIQKYNSQVPNGYNIDIGGRNCPKPKTQNQKELLMWGQAKLTEEEVIELRKAYQQQKSPTQIFNEKYQNRLHWNSFLNIWTGSRYKHIMPEVFKDRDKHTKMTIETARAIREEYKNSKTSYQALAEKYQVSKATVADIVKERTWKDTKEPVSTIAESGK